MTKRSGAPASRGRPATPTPSGDDASVVPVFDGHNDLLTALRWPRRSGPRDVFAENENGHLDLPRMRAGAMAGGFFSLFVPSQVAPNDFAAHTDARGHYRLPLPGPLEPDRALRDVVAMLAALRRIEAASGGALRMVRDPEAARAAMAAGAVAAALHLEGADAIDPDLDALWLLHAAGLRALGPAWSRPNLFAHGVPLAFPALPDQGPGLSEAGRALVRGCDELGILIDVSHLTAAGFWDVLDEAQGVVVASHSNAHALCPHARNLTDRQLDALAERGGVVGLNFGTGFLAPDGSWDTRLPLEVMVRHLEHLVARLGPHGVALGSDFDGARIPSAIGDAAGLPALFAALRRAGWDEEALTLLASENWLRVWGAVAPVTRFPPRTPVLFSSARSPHCFKVSVALLELGVAFERVEIDLPGREQKTAEYLAINPRGQVPAYLDVDGAHLDSLDILLHLDARQRPPRLFPADPVARKATLAWIACSSGPMRDVSHHLYWQLLEPPTAGPDLARVAELRAQGSELLEGVEAALAASRSGWLVDTDDLAGPSAADMCVYAWTSGFRRFELPGPEARRPRLERWWRWWDERPSVLASRGAVGVPFRGWLEGRGVSGGTEGDDGGSSELG